MKSGLIFLLALVLAGSLVPCCPADNCAQEITACQPQEDQPEHKDGACSPFFACGTCTGFVQLAVHCGVGVPAFQQPLHVEKSPAFFSSTYCASFFQPPRQNGAPTV